MKEPRYNVTRALIGLNLLGFLWEIIVTHGAIIGFFFSGDVDAAYAGAIIPPAVLHYHQWYRIVTAGFLHGNIMHIFVNMISLWSLGRFMEYVLGQFKMATLYMLSLIASSIAVVLWADPQSASLGASGAIFGLFGALFAIGLRLGKPGMDLVKSNIGILVLNLVITFTIPAISWQAHIGGLIAGFVLGFILYTPPKRIAAPVVDADTGQALETEYQAPQQ